MSTMTTEKNPIKIREVGLQALNTVLGPEDAQIFLDQYSGQFVGRGDFTKERHERPERSNEEIFADILQLQEEEADFIATKNAEWERKMTAKKKMA